MLGGVVFSTLRTFLADNAGIGLPLGIERVIGIGSKYKGFPLAIPRKMGTLAIVRHQWISYMPDVANKAAKLILL